MTKKAVWLLSVATSVLAFSGNGEARDEIFSIASDATPIPLGDCESIPGITNVEGSLIEASYVRGASAGLEDSGWKVVEEGQCAGGVIPAVSLLIQLANGTSVEVVVGGMYTRNLRKKFGADGGLRNRFEDSLGNRISIPVRYEGEQAVYSGGPISLEDPQLGELVQYEGPTYSVSKRVSPSAPEGFSPCMTSAIDQIQEPQRLGVCTNISEDIEPECRTDSECGGFECSGSKCTTIPAPNIATLEMEDLRQQEVVADD